MKPHRWRDGERACLRWGRSWTSQSKDYKTCIIKEKKQTGWLRIRIICQSETTCHPQTVVSVSEHHKNQTMHVGLVQWGIIIIWTHYLGVWPLQSPLYFTIITSYLKMSAMPCIFPLINFVWLNQLHFLANCSIF